MEIRFLHGLMARRLRLERPGGRYHVAAAGNERREIFRDETDRFHFLSFSATGSLHVTSGEKRLPFCSRLGRFHATG